MDLTSLMIKFRPFLNTAQAGREVADDLEAALASPNLAGLNSFDGAEEKPSGYSRKLLHADPSGQFSIIGIHWRPGARTPVHGHLVWCLFGILEGVITERAFRVQSPDGKLQLESESLLPAGTVRTDVPDSNAHQLCNRTDQLALSLHIYGVEGTLWAGGINRIYQPA